MIADSIANAQKYSSLHPSFKQAFEFLSSSHQKTPSQYDLDGKRLYVIVSKQDGKLESASFLEAHRRYIDIHYCIAGAELIGWRAVATCTKVDKPYDEDRDVLTFFDQPDVWLTLESGSFAIFFPEDAHAPGVSDGPFLKAVVKVLL
jgi:biofilm protein TabA